jgi:hypothetical protein
MKLSIIITAGIIGLIGLWIWENSRPHYELFKGYGGDVLLNTRTGETWLYYHNSNTKPEEGFRPLSQVAPVPVIDFQPSTNPF